MKTKMKELECICRYCENASCLQTESQMLCKKKGVVNAVYTCRAFRYDPLKRDPGKIRSVPPLEFVDLDESEE